MQSILKEEKNLIFVFLFATLAIFSEKIIFSLNQPLSLLFTVLVMVFIILASLRVAHHAELLAEKVGEPYGTMILTLCAVLVEVVILVIIMNKSDNPTLARDTIYSAIMLDINCILGMAAFIGGIKHGEQNYNDDSSKSYLAMIVTAIGISMIIPEFINPEKWKVYSIFCIVVMTLLYGLFLKIQTSNHSYFFSYNYADKGVKHLEKEENSNINVKKSVIILILGIVMIGFLAEIMAHTLETGIKGTSIPVIFAGILVAVISASPEIVTALKSAFANRMQPVINIALGATLSTVILTIPVIQLISLINNKPIEMALTPVQTGMVLITILVSFMNQHDGESNAIEGMTHFVLFLTFIMLAFIGY
jgi:Ca2+:H+ antiporter